MIRELMSRAHWKSQKHQDAYHAGCQIKQSRDLSRGGMKADAHGLDQKIARVESILKNTRRNRGTLQAC
jgi:hypothetical protein